MRPGLEERRTHDSVRPGAAPRFAALAVASGTVTRRICSHHRHQEFLRSLQALDARCPRRQLHLVLDNYRTHKRPEVRAWLSDHECFHLHFTPTSATLMNQVECWFSILPGTSSSAVSSAASWP
ncbi:MAG: transposase [Candidatus Dormibacteria bacterium]